ncbi:DUF3618 domain-containing protein [Sphingosinicella sp. BN140058]|uniref:DUF3618 domain-containing protein n=1 Tax=Sphingosinicella sp. BN140058 TaxID=1892855 RepID=UPI0013ED9F0D|nr:DUF3618 domain-containing protein [Sphingosinicella sp. BN140058]
MTADSNADVIEDDIRRTQDRIGETIDRLEEQLSPPRLAKSLLGDDKNDIAREVLEITRQNPVPVALIAIGVIWLVATARTRNGSRLADLLTPGGAASGDGARAPRSAEASTRFAAAAPIAPQEPAPAWRPIGSAPEPTERADLLGSDTTAYSDSLRSTERGPLL